MPHRPPSLVTGKNIAVIVDNAVAAFFFCLIYYKAVGGMRMRLTRKLRTGR